MDIGLDIVTSDWAGGYVTGIGYSYGYYPELAPSFLQYVLLARGYQPPAPRGTTRKRGR